MLLLLKPVILINDKIVDPCSSGEKIWVGLRFRNDAEWFWDNGSNEPVIWGISVNQVGQILGLIVLKDYDRAVTVSTLVMQGYFVVHIMMPQSQSDAAEIATNLDCGHCWVGVTDFDADHIYTWEDGTDINQFSLYFGGSEPNKRDKDYICAYIQKEQFYNGECTTLERVICEIHAIDNSQTTTSTQISTQMESTSAEIQITTYTSTFNTNPTTLSKLSTQLEATSAKVQTTVHTSAIKTTHTTGAKTSTPYDANTASGTGPTGTKTSTDDTLTTINKSVVQSDNATIMPCKFSGPVISASAVDCIVKCTSNLSENLNSSDDVSLNIPYKVDLKSLSSYRRRQKSADDPRMSSFYIGYVGIAVLVMSILSIIMLDFLPSA
ncbi:unnamed protein product [Mytilus coruscus]|uniref:C-type lectin domain-containing protein n=1 Tax=Mytilus coruscus TaxID=42192 RepID=A0A6J8B8N5_MYTCO|nr:unnamed protein product [Mytilus coruscus]